MCSGARIWEAAHRASSNGGGPVEMKGWRSRLGSVQSCGMGEGTLEGNGGQSHDGTQLKCDRWVGRRTANAEYQVFIGRMNIEQEGDEQEGGAPIGGGVGETEGGGCERLDRGREGV